VLLAYSKKKNKMVSLSRHCSIPTLPYDDYFIADLNRYFPRPCRGLSGSDCQPSLKREIIATVATKAWINPRRHHLLLRYCRGYWTCRSTLLRRYAALTDAIAQSCGKALNIR